MTMLNQLKSGDIARIISLENEHVLKKKFISNILTEGNIIRIISHFGLITFSINSKIFSVSSGIANNIGVIKIK